MAYTCEERIGDRIVLKPWDEVPSKAYNCLGHEYKFGILKNNYDFFLNEPPKIIDVSKDYVRVKTPETGELVIPKQFIDTIIPREKNEKKSNSVNHPNHYNQGGMEVWDVIKAFTENLSGAEAFYAGNAIKYILRWDKKNGTEDLEKAKVYIDKLIESRKGENK